MKKLKSIKGIPLKYIQSVVKIDSKSLSGLTWLPRQDIRKEWNSVKEWNAKNAYNNAGSVNTNQDGYKKFVIMIRYNNKQYNLTISRVVLLLKNGYLTEGKIIDHIDGNSLNNIVTNLREVTPSQNNMNSKLPKNNTSGCKGVCWDKSRNKWMVQICYGKVKFTGRYDNEEDAIKASIEARKKLHGTFGRIK